MSLSIKTRYKGNSPKYKENLNSATIFFDKGGDDRITTIQGTEVNIEIYKDGELLFIGDKNDLFNILIKNK